MFDTLGLTGLMGNIPQDRNGFLEDVRNCKYHQHSIARGCQP